ncbi:unnamed protein product [Camellia sinensis]
MTPPPESGRGLPGSPPNYRRQQNQSHLSPPNSLPYPWLFLGLCSSVVGQMDIHAPTANELLTHAAPRPISFSFPPPCTASPSFSISLRWSFAAIIPASVSTNLTKSSVAADVPPAPPSGNTTVVSASLLEPKMHASALDIPVSKVKDLQWRIFYATRISDVAGQMVAFLGVFDGHGGSSTALS